MPGFFFACPRVPWSGTREVPGKLRGVNSGVNANCTSESLCGATSGEWWYSIGGHRAIGMRTHACPGPGTGTSSMRIAPESLAGGKMDPRPLWSADHPGPLRADARTIGPRSNQRCAVGSRQEIVGRRF